MATKDKRLVKPSKGHSPAIMSKGTAHRDRTKYRRKEKHNESNHIPKDERD